MRLGHILRQIGPDRGNLRHDRSRYPDLCRPILAHRCHRGGGHIIKAIPSREAAARLICLTIRGFVKEGRNHREWFAARNHCAIIFGEHFI